MISYAEIIMIRGLALMAYAFTTLLSQTSHVPYAPNSDGPEPTFSSAVIADTFPGRYSSIEQVDFRNVRPLRNGRYRDKSDGGRFSEQLVTVYYLNGKASKRQAGLVLYFWSDGGGSSSQGRVARVFRIVDGALRSNQQISWDTHFQPGQPFVTFNRKRNTLVIRSAHYIPGDAHCCVSAMDVVTFHWDGRAFVQRDLRTELSEYGKKAGKQLPH